MVRGCCASAQTADRVGVAGLGRTLADGHRHEVDWSAAGVDRIFDILHDATEKAGRSPEIDVLVQHVQITDVRSAELEVGDHVALVDDGVSIGAVVHAS